MLCYALVHRRRWDLCPHLTSPFASRQISSLTPVHTLLHHADPSYFLFLSSFNLQSSPSIPLVFSTIMPQLYARDRTFGTDTHSENKTSLHCSEARTLIYLYSIDCRDRGLDRKTIRVAVNSRARFRSTNAPVPSPTPSHTTFYSMPVSPRARTHAMKPYSTLRIHSYQPRVHKALVILRNPSTKSDALQLVLRSRGGFQASNETFNSLKSCLDEGS